MIRVGVDVGGTFTDLVALDGTRVTTGKVPSTPDDQSEGVMRALEAIEAGDVTAFAHGMTVAHERAARAPRRAHGARHHRGLPRPDRARPPGPPVALRPAPSGARSRSCRATCASRCSERMGPEGELEPLDEDSLKRGRRRAARGRGRRRRGLPAVRVPAPRARAAGRRSGRGGAPGRSTSRCRARCCPSSASTSASRPPSADAYLGPKLAAYLERLARRRRRGGRAGAAGHAVLGRRGRRRGGRDGGRRLRALRPGRRRGRRARTSRAAERLRGRADLRHGRHEHRRRAGRCGGEASTTTESVVAGVPIKLPMVDVHTVSAGGGSIAWVDPGGALRVGPRSAGADPGPAAYGKGGEEPTVTDANLVLGYLGRRRGAGRRADAVGASRRGRADGARRRARPRRARDRARRRARRQRRDGPRAAGDLGRARARPARVRARRLRRRRAGCTPARWPRSSASRAVLVPRAGGVLSALGLAMSDVRRDDVRPLLGGEDAEEPRRDGGAGGRGHGRARRCAAAPTCATAASRSS